ncbi:MAG TPA: GIY-YIG nuclease family protein [Candidatus Binatia bacterium]
MSKRPAVYILASKRNGTLYIGVTSDIPKRIGEHKNDLVEGFTQRYRVHRLVYYELHENMESAISREKQMKKGSSGFSVGLPTAMQAGQLLPVIPVQTGIHSFQ